MGSPRWFLSSGASLNQSITLSLTLFVFCLHHNWVLLHSIISLLNLENCGIAAPTPYEELFTLYLLPGRVLHTSRSSPKNGVHAPPISNSAQEISPTDRRPHDFGPTGLSRPSSSNPPVYRGHRGLDLLITIDFPRYVFIPPIADLPDTLTVLHRGRILVKIRWGLGVPAHGTNYTQGSLHRGFRPAKTVVFSMVAVEVWVWSCIKLSLVSLTR